MKKGKRIISLLLGIIGLFMMNYGAERGEMLVIFNKAVRVCLECIGIG